MLGVQGRWGMRRNLLSGYFKSFSIDSDFYPDFDKRTVSTPRSLLPNPNPIPLPNLYSLTFNLICWLFCRRRRNFLYVALSRPHGQIWLVHSNFDEATLATFRSDLW